MEQALQKTEESIFYILVSSGYEREGDIFTKTVQGPSQVMVVNGQQMTNPGKQIKIQFKYLGQGDIEGTPIYGFELLQDKQSQIVEYVYDSTEFHDRFYSFL